VILRAELRTFPDCSKARFERKFIEIPKIYNRADFYLLNKTAKNGGNPVP
jgi:hypothetical protein